MWIHKPDSMIKSDHCQCPAETLNAFTSISSETTDKLFIITITFDTFNFAHLRLFRWTNGTTKDGKWMHELKLCTMYTQVSARQTRWRVPTSLVTVCKHMRKTGRFGGKKRGGWERGEVFWWDGNRSKTFTRCFYSTLSCIYFNNPLQRAGCFGRTVQRFCLCLTKIRHVADFTSGCGGSFLAGWSDKNLNTKVSEQHFLLVLTYAKSVVNSYLAALSWGGNEYWNIYKPQMSIITKSSETICVQGARSNSVITVVSAVSAAGSVTSVTDMNDLIHTGNHERKKSLCSKWATAHLWSISGVITAAQTFISLREINKSNWGCAGSKDRGWGRFVGGKIKDLGQEVKKYLHAVQRTLLSKKKKRQHREQTKDAHACLWNTETGRHKI